MDSYDCLDLTYEEVMKLITAYKNQGLLWNPHSYLYHSSKQTKEEAWKLVAAASGIEVIKCKRKIRSLTSSCRRQKMLIIKSMCSGNPEKVVKPTWRYWNAFKFLRGLEDDEVDPLGTAPVMDILDPSLDSTAMKIKLRRLKEEQEPSTSVLNMSVGQMVASKLNKMYPDQRLYAENLIKQALSMGSKEKLTSHSKIRTLDFENGQKRKLKKIDTDILDSQPSSSKSFKKLDVKFSSQDVSQDEFDSHENSSISSGFESEDDLKPLSML